MTKRALISVFEKDGIVDFARKLTDLGWEIISTGGTYKLLKLRDLKKFWTEELKLYIRSFMAEFCTNVMMKIM